MALPGSGRQRRALTASAVKVGERDSDYQRRMSLPWQQRALTYIDIIPELNYASRFYSRMLKQLRIFPAMLSDVGDENPITSGEPVDLLNRIQDPGGGRSQILGDYGRLMFITGEGNLFGRNLGTPEERWSFVWNDELKIDQNSDGSVRTITWRPSLHSNAKEFSGEEAVVYKMWTAHPRRSGESDAPMRSALEIAEELIILTSAVHATAVSRITGGVLLMPNNMAPPAAEPSGDEDPLNDPFLSDIADVFEAQVKNPGAASARIPPVIWGDYELIDRIRHVPLHDPQTDYMEQKLRTEAVQRLARGFDMPMEVLLGLGGSNHWASLQILNDMWKSHGAPIAEQFCDDLNEAYLRPALREAKYEGWEKVVIDYDESEVVIKPDRGDDADKALDRAAIGFPAYRTMKNIPEGFKPTPEEIAQIMAMKGKTPAGGNTGGVGAPEGPRNAPLGPKDPSEGPPEPGPQGDSGRKTRMTASAARELGAATMALWRCRELAGMRIRNKERICPECVKPAEDQPLVLVAATIGPERLARMQLDPLALVKGGTDAFAPLLDAWGYHNGQATALCEMIEVYAARTLFDSDAPSLPSGFVAQVEQMKELSTNG